jgi:D-alanyl-lipoteichoic acid acyltransferase DltB (MBOAT superfamily)
MLFNSIGFALFLPIVFVLYWFVTRQNLLYQNILLLISSYFFYACWDWRFLFLLVFSTFLDYSTAIKMYDSKNKMWKKFWFWLSICVNVGFLGFFKYYNFFVQSFAEGLSDIGLKANFWTLKIILPVGISFYTFHGLSYVIDIYNNRIRPEKNFIDYSVFVSFFPLLVAGPIERATHLLPQIQQKRAFDYSKAADGLRQILWGLFKKMVIADNCAKFANNIFNYSDNFSGATLFLGAFFFAVQIYCDFSGYSDIAIGTARLFGLDLLRNFAFPYFSRDIAEFWRRWHISLSTWFRDYLYIPLGGSKVGRWMKVRNILIIFLVSGFWHGANWTFIIWGFLNAIYIMPSILRKTNRNNLDIVGQGNYLPTIREFFSMLVTFGLTVLAWIFFREENVSKAFHFVIKIFTGMFKNPAEIFLGSFWLPYITILILIGLFFVIEWLGREHQYALANMGLKWPKLFRMTFYFCIILTIFIFAGSQQKFIYFQF